MKTLKEINAMECNKRARAKYAKVNTRPISVRLTAEEIEIIENFCERTGINKNLLFRTAAMEYIGKSIK